MLRVVHLESLLRSHPSFNARFIFACVCAFQPRTGADALLGRRARSEAVLAQQTFVVSEIVPRHGPMDRARRARSERQERAGARVDEP